MTGVPREPASGGEVVRVTRPGGRTPPETLEQVNQQYLKSKYKFKEGAPLKEYLQQRISSFSELCTLVEVLTWLKEIIQDNLLFDERNPAMIVGDAPLKAALRKRKVHVNDIRSVVIQQLTMVEARQGPWNPAMLIGGMTRLGRVPVGPRPEVQAVTAPASAQGVRVMSLTKVPARSVVLRSPAPGITEVPARSVVMHSPVPGIPQEIGTVSYTAPSRPAAGQNAGGAAAVAMSTGAGFTGVRIRPLIRMPGASRGPPPQQGSGGEHQSGHCDIDTTAGQCWVDRRIHGIQLRRHETPRGGIRADSSSRMLDETTGAREPEAQGRKDCVDARRSSVPCRSLQNDGDGDASRLWRKGRVGTLEDDRDREAGPNQPPRLLEHIGLRKGNLVYRAVTLTRNGTAIKTLEERINCDSRGRDPIRRSSGGPGKAHVQLTMRRIAVWRRMATESITKKAIMKGVHDSIPNYVAGGMDATESTYVWDYNKRNCPEEEWEELYKGRLGVLEDEVITLDRSAGQRAWLKLEKGVTICGKRMRSTHLPRVYVEWDGHQRAPGTTKKYATPPKERELESMRLEWSYQRGRDDYMLRRKIQGAVTEGCWMQGMLMELRQSQAAALQTQFDL